MRNIRMRIEYDGTDFKGWQFQPRQRTVQGEIESALRKMTGTRIRINGAGRTDQGVHAVGQVVNFNIESSLRLDEIQKGLNSLIGDDIYIVEIIEVNPDFHARFSAKSKVYDYRIIRLPSPLRRRYSWYVGYKLDVAVMEKTVPFLKGEHDFANFAVADARRGVKRISMRNDTIDIKENTLCTIYDLFLTENDFDIIITFKADRFLRKMVRGIVGFIVDAGRGRFLPEDVLRVFGGQVKDLNFAPPQGLCLMEVQY